MFERAKDTRKEERLNLCGEEVQRLRQERGWSILQMQVLLANHGLDLDLHRLEQGHCEVSDTELGSLSHALAVPLEQLVWGKEGMPSDKSRMGERVRTLIH